MKNGKLIYIALMLSAAILVSCTSGEKPSLRRQEISVTLIPESNEIEGKSRILLKTRGASQLSFTLSPNAVVTGSFVDGKPAHFTFIDGVLSVDLRDAPGNRDVSLDIGYRCSFNDQPSAESLSGEDPTYGINAVVSQRGVFLGPGAGWYPSPTVMPRKREVRVTAPAGVEAITAGKRTHRGTSGGETTSVWEEARPVDGLSLSAGRYLVGESTDLGRVPVYTYLTPENASFSKRYLDASVRHVRFYENLLGPYPFEKFAVVENFFPSGYGFPSYTLLGNTIIRLPFIPETSLPHEIAHSWWGNGVLIDERGGNWSEGLVTYLSDYLQEERKSPAAGREYRFNVLSDYASLVTPDRDFPLSEFSKRTDPASRVIGYGKGMMFFHMIRKEVGDEIFYRGLREILRKHLFARVSWEEFVDTFSSLSGRDLSGFRKEWLGRGGGPRISFTEVRSDPLAEGWRVAGSVSQQEPYYHIPISLELETEGGYERKTIHSAGWNTPFSFTVKDRPRRLRLDPEADLFRLLSRDEISPSVNRIKGSRSLVVVVAANYRGSVESLELLLETLGQKGATVMSEKEATSERISGHDILICGVPENMTIPPDVSPTGFTLDNRDFRNRDDTLFMVSRKPREPERVAAIFLPLSRDAARRSVAKITHYGRYGFLAFRGGENVVKGIDEPLATGVSVIDLSKGSR